jgi:peptide chain release factor
MNMEKLLLISSGKGPEECGRAAYLVMKLIEKEAMQRNVAVEALSIISRGDPSFVSSALLRLCGYEAAPLAQEWSGTILWKAPSPFRPNHRRKNWFVSVKMIRMPELIGWHDRDVKYESMRASGPEGNM